MTLLRWIEHLQSEENQMPYTSNIRRRFAIRAAIAKREANTIVLKNGLRVTITASNAKFVEKMRQKEAEDAIVAAYSVRLAA
jgi:hypothetical protein